jgi:hypothetical protein
VGQRRRQLCSGGRESETRVSFMTIQHILMFVKSQILEGNSRRLVGFSKSTSDNRYNGIHFTLVN